MPKLILVVSRGLLIKLFWSEIAERVIRISKSHALAINETFL